MKRTAQ
jgi:hypothetical protein